MKSLYFAWFFLSDFVGFVSIQTFSIEILSLISFGLCILLYFIVLYFAFQAKFLLMRHVV